MVGGVSIRLLHNYMERYLKSGEGRTYYERGHVLGLNVGKSNITAKVQGRYVYDVIVNRRSFDLSWCSCPKDGYCKHMAAVVYAAVGQEEAGSSVVGMAMKIANCCCACIVLVGKSWSRCCV